jgi:preprotein translocase subunit SecA
MVGGLLRQIFGSSNDRILAGFKKTVDEINAAEPELEALSNEDLRARTDLLRKRCEDGESLDDLLIDAFATVREAAKRTLGQRHYDVQLLGGIILHQGQIAEMKTGEGKTLVSTLPVYLHALGGQGVHVVTVNDYLAKRDAGWMGQIYEFLGMTVGCIVHELSDDERRAAYGCDITYGTNNELGFDYLRDNMKFRLADMVQREFNYAIVDEVDSILIDEARTPLIISGQAEDSSELYRRVDALIPQLTEDDYEKDEKQRAVTLTEDGQTHMEELLRQEGLLSEGGLYDLQNVSLVHHANQSLKAHKSFTRDVDYIVKDDKIVIIDEFTGRMMEGRRYSDGLHQSLEAKERVTIQNENQTLASITFQNYFRLYPTLAGMTGTALTEAGEFGEIYGLEVIDMPTNRPMIRADMDDEVYRTEREKHDAILEQIKDCHSRKQPVLVGTVSIEKSEELSAMLKKHKIKHHVLNARQHEKEAYIIGDAGVPGAVTIATNMAGRGTDIQLGGNLELRLWSELEGVEDEAKRTKLTEKIKADIEKNRAVVLEAGGLYVLGTERHESRRIDNQLRGRSGRQGDPGGSKFFVSLEDDLMRIFGSERMDGMLQKLGLEEGEAIVHRWINKALEKAQEKVEARNFEIRKQLLKFDDVMNDQRKVIFEQRKEMMRADDVNEDIVAMRHETVEEIVERCIPPGAYSEEWEVDSLREQCIRVFGMELPVADWAAEEGIADQEIKERITDAIDRKMAEKAATFGPELMRYAEKTLLLQLLDQNWKDHLLQLDHLRQGIHLRGYGQRDPLNEYKQEAFSLFEALLEQLRTSVTEYLAHLQVRTDPQPDATGGEAAGPAGGGPGGGPGPSAGYDPSRMQETRTDPALGGGQPLGDGSPVHSRAAARQVDPGNPATWGKVQRNAACPCGSGKKYKHCHGRAV